MVSAADDDLDALATLADPTRRAVYRAVIEADGAPVSREDIAAALDVGRTLAAFHLDKLAEAGLLTVAFARRSGRTGPGAGRPAKLYQRSGDERWVSLPPRTYEAVATLLAEAVERAGADGVAFEVARSRGRALAASGSGDLRARLVEQGYEPVDDDATLRLRNCPFHRVADAFPPIVCGMNLALLQALAEKAEPGWTARIDPTPHHCCVSFSKNNTD
jgi:predicted ArsR family transcriptional regulator